MTATSAARGVSCLQVNTGRMRDSHDIIEVEACKRGVDVLIISEPNKTVAKQKQWLVDDEVNVALVIRNDDLPTGKQGRERGFVWVEIGAYRVYSCYISPNVDMASFETFLEYLGSSVRGTQKITILGGDFNAKSYLWGEKQDPRGETLTDWLSQLQLIVTNEDTTPTFVRGIQESVLDLTLCPSGCANVVQRWEALEEETLSYHKMICFVIVEANKITQTRPTREHRG